MEMYSIRQLLAHNYDSVLCANIFLIFTLKEEAVNTFKKKKLKNFYLGKRAFHHVLPRGFTNVDTDVFIIKFSSIIIVLLTKNSDQCNYYSKGIFRPMFRKTESGCL